MINNDEYIIGSLIQRLREGNERKIIIEDFPLKKEYFNLFARNGKLFSKLIHLKCDDFQCFQRMKALDPNSAEFIGSAKLNQLIQEWDKKKDVLNMVIKNENYHELDANRPFNIVSEEVMDVIKPNLLIFKSYSEEGLSQLKQLSQLFIRYKDFYKLDVVNLLKESVQRGNKVGKAIAQFIQGGSIDSKLIPNSLIIEVLKDVVFSPIFNNYIIYNISEQPSDVIQTNQYRLLNLNVRFARSGN